MPLDEALERVRKHVVFTTHTPLQAGNESYPPEQFLEAFGELAAPARHLETRRSSTSAASPRARASRACRRSRCACRAGATASAGGTASWRARCGSRCSRARDVPIDHVTNGAHLATYLGDPMYVLLARHLGERWMRSPADPEAWAPVRHIPNDELWRARTAARRRLAEFAQQKAEQDRLLRGEDIEYVRAGADLLDADTLTFGFARRLAGYKRLSLLVADPAARAQAAHGAAADPGADRRQGAPARRDRQAAARAALRAARRDRPGRRARRLPRGLRPRARPPARLGLRRVGQPAAAAAGGERHERDEGDVQRLPPPQRARRLVGGGLQRQERLGDRGRPEPRPLARRRAPTPTPSTRCSRTR